MLAICEGVSGSARFWGIVLPPLLVAVWCFFLFVVFLRTNPEDRLPIFAVFAASIGIGAFVFLFPDGVSGDGDYLARFLYSVLGVAALGAAGALWRGGIGWRLVGAAVLGDVFVPGLLVLHFAWSLSLAGGCIG